MGTGNNTCRYCNVAQYRAPDRSPTRWLSIKRLSVGAEKGAAEKTISKPALGDNIQVEPTTARIAVNGKDQGAGSDTSLPAWSKNR